MLFRITTFLTKKWYTQLFCSGTKLQCPHMGIPHKISYTRSSWGSKFTAELPPVLAWYPPCGLTLPWPGQRFHDTAWPLPGSALALPHATYSTSGPLCGSVWLCPGQPERRTEPGQCRGTNKHSRRQAALLVSLHSEPRPAAPLRSQAQPKQGGGWKGSLAYFAPSQHIPRTPALRGFTQLAVCYTHLAVSLNTTFGKSYLP